MSSVAIVSPGYPDSAGGVTDHTARLVKSWTDLGASVHVCADASESVGSVVHTLRTTGAEAVLVQYVPFLYGPRGLSALPEGIAKDCQRLGIRVTTFVHEPWVPPTRLPWLLLSPLQRLQLQRVLAASNTAVTAVPAWRRLFRRKTVIVYVGSTLGDPPKELSSCPPLGAPVVFSPFAAGLRWDWIMTAVNEVGAGLSVVGADRDTATNHPHIGRYMDEDWDFWGRVPADEAIRLLARSTLVLAPFVDGITGRRTSAMAALSIGARLLTSSGPLYDPDFTDGPAIVVDSRSEFSRTAAELWRTEDTPSAREKRTEWYNEHFSPADLDSRLLDLVMGRCNH